jgi:predicted DNA-binding WGR domain protein
MANVCDGDSPSPHIVLERIDPAGNIARYYVLSIEPTLFAKHTLVRRWGRIGCLAVSFQEVVHSGPTVNADVAKPQ